MEEESSISLSEIISMMWRRKWLLILTSLIILIVGLIVITKLPATYRATGVIIVEQQEIPTQWVNSTVSSYADERIQAIGQRVLTTENISSIIRNYDLYKDEIPTSSMDELVAKAIANFNVENVRATIRDRTTGRTNSATVAFRISFDDPSAQMAKDIAERFVDLYLNENVKSRTKAIVDTRQFLETEADRLEQDLALIEEKISQFKEENFGALPEHQALNISAFQRTEQQINDIDRSLASLNERRIILEAGIDSALRYIEAGRASDGAVPVVDPLEERLGELRSEYAGLLTKYSDLHPDLIKLKREIAAVEQQMAEQETSSAPLAQTVANGLLEQNDTSLVRLRTELQSAATEQESLRNKKVELLAKLEELDALINKTPEVEREYGSLIRDYDNIQAKYNDIRSKQNSARVSESLEIEQKGERFTLIEPPRLPTSPHKPNRKKLAVVALGASIAGGMGLIFGLELMDGRVRNIRGLERLAGVPVLATIGHIQNTSDRRKRRRTRLFWLLFFVLIIGGILYIVNYFQIKPEDVTIDQIKGLLNDSLKHLGQLGARNG